MAFSRGADISALEVRHFIHRGGSGGFLCKEQLMYVIVAGKRVGVGGYFMVSGAQVGNNGT